MRIAAVVLLLGVGSLGQGEEKGLAIDEKAARAHGGEANLNKLRISKITYTIAGDFSFIMPGGKNIQAEIEETFQLPSQVKKVIKAKIEGKEIKLAWAVDGDSYWYHSDEDNKTVTVNKRLNVETMFRPFGVLDLLGKFRQRTTWKPAGDKLFYGQKTVAVAVKCPDLESEGTFYFDKTTGLLAGMARKINLEKSKEMVQETHLTDYQNASVLKLPMKQILYHDGKKVGEIRVVNVRLLDKVNPAEFAVPGK